MSKPRKLATLTDAQIVEDARQRMQTSMSQAIQAFGQGKTVSDFAAEYGLPRTAMTVAAADVREIGSFVLDLPEGAPARARRQWVYRCRDDREIVYIVSWKNRMSFQQLGFAQIEVFVDDTNARD